MSKDRNPSKSTLIQGLLEAERTGRYNTKLIEDMIKELQKSPQGIREADSAVENKPYNEEKVTFYQSPVFTQCNRELKLSASAVKLLNIVRMAMSQQNVVRIDRKICSRLLELKDRQTRVVIKELVDSRILVVSKPQAGHNPPEYMVNPRVGHRSKRPDVLIQRFWKLCGMQEPEEITSADRNFLRSPFPELTTGTDFAKDDPGSSCGYIKVSADKQKKSPQVTTPEDSKDNSSIHNNDTMTATASQDFPEDLPF